MSEYGTPYLESEAILAVQATDYAYAREVLMEMSPGELKGLSDAALSLSALISEVAVEKRQQEQS